MPELSNINVVREILGRHGFKFSKSFGQNFIVNPDLCPRIAEESGVGPGICALEIGPGMGVLTKELALRAEKVLSIEIDKALLPVLDETLAEFDNVTILNADVLELDLKSVIKEHFGDMPFVVCANLPYYITSPIIMKLLEENRELSASNGMDFAAKFLSYIPGVFLKFAVWLLKLLDYFGLLPKSLVKVSPFHGSMFLTNMGSLGIDPIYHHLYDFGNLPLFCAMGKKRTEYKLNADGTVRKVRMMDITIVCDERICDGHYYASAFKTLKKHIENPHMLEAKPEKVVCDIK